METNGTAQQSLKDLRRQRAMLEEQVKIEQLQTRRKASQQRASLWESYYDEFFVQDYYGGTHSNIFNRVRGRNEYDSVDAPPGNYSDRKQGDDWPIFRNPIELSKFRQASRMVVKYNGYARALVRNMVNYVIGKGFEYKPVSTDDVPDAKEDVPGKQDSPRTDKLEKMVARWIKDFSKKNKWKWKQRECYRRVIRDGEAFIRMFFQPNGETLIRFVEPESIIDPPGHTYTDGWSYGIRHEVNKEYGADVETVLEYHAHYPEPGQVRGKGEMPLGDIVPASEMVHIKDSETDANVKRGMPVFYGDVITAVERASVLQRNISAGAAVRAATAEIWEYEFGTQSNVSSLVGDHRDYQRQDPVTGRTVDVEQIQPGTVRRLPTGVKYAQRESNTGVPEFLEGVQGDLRLASGAVSAPEYFTGDASNANYASTMVASAPFTRSSEAEQSHVEEAFIEVMTRAMHHAVEKGVLPREVLTVIEIQAAPPKVVHRDMVQQAVVDERLVMLGAKDRQTVSMEWGYEWEEVKANNAEWEEIHGAYTDTIPPYPHGGAGGGAQSGAKAGGGMGTGAGMRESWIREADSYFADCPRDDKGHCEGGAGGAAADGGQDKPSTGGDVHAQAGEKAKSLLAKAASLPKAALDKAVNASKSLYTKMEAKVGPRWAKAIVATAIVTAPTPVMTGSILAMTGLAFAYTRLVSGGHIQASADTPGEPAEQELTDEQVKQLAAELLAELEKEMAAWPPA